MVSRVPDSLSNWNLEMLVLEERGKPEYPEKNLFLLASKTDKPLGDDTFQNQSVKLMC